MRMRRIGGPRGFDVSALCLGTMHFGTRVPEKECFAVLDRFHEAGGTFIDTANTYAFWADGATGAESEIVLGKWLRERGLRDEIVLATKVGALPDPPGAPWPHAAEGLSAEVIARQVERSLTHLQTDWIDIYYAHIDDRDTPPHETMAAFGGLVAQGKIRQYGCSNYAAWRIEESQQAAARQGLPGFTAVQQRYTYLQPKPGADFGVNPHASEEILDYLCNRPELTLLGYTTQLAGAYTDQRKEIPEQYRHEGSAARLAALAEVAGELGATKNQVVLSWLAGGEPSVLPIIGASTAAQLEESLGAMDLKLPADARARLDRAA
jgi:aryl-alcohol dehydrogenase-like predicted oxidoreductase